MKVKICDSCLERKAKVCEKCRRKASQEYIDTVRSIHRLGKSFSSLEKTEILDVIRAGGILFIVVPKDHVTKLIGADGKTAAAIASEVGSRIRVVGKGSSIERVLTSVFLPVRLLRLNRVYPRDREEYIKVCISREEEKKLPMERKRIERLCLRLVGKKVTVVEE